MTKGRHVVAFWKIVILRPHLNLLSMDIFKLAKVEL